MGYGFGLGIGYKMASGLGIDLKYSAGLAGISDEDVDENGEHRAICVGVSYMFGGK